MSAYFETKYEITEVLSDGYGRLHPAAILYFVQEAAGKHCVELGVEDARLGGLFWAVLRYRVEVDRMPAVGETVTVRTWPLPTTKVAFPRAAAGYDQQGNRLFRLISLWVLMDEKTRQMVLPGRSGVLVPGQELGEEIAVPAGLKAIPTENMTARIVTELEIDKNRHMNNTRYLDWAMDLLPRDYVKNHRLKAFTACYFNEARLDDELALCWTLENENQMYLDSYRITDDAVDKGDRVFSARIEFEGIM